MKIEKGIRLVTQNHARPFVKKKLYGKDRPYSLQKAESRNLRLPTGGEHYVMPASQKS